MVPVTDVSGAYSAASHNRLLWTIVVVGLWQRSTQVPVVVQSDDKMNHKRMRLRDQSSAYELGLKSHVVDQPLFYLTLFISFRVWLA